MHIDNKGFEIHKQRDQLKKDYCMKHNIPLYIIKYNENIDEKINKILLIYR